MNPFLYNFIKKFTFTVFSVKRIILQETRKIKGNNKHLVFGILLYFFVDYIYYITKYKKILNKYFLCNKIIFKVLLTSKFEEFYVFSCNKCLVLCVSFL